MSVTREEALLAAAEAYVDAKVRIETERLLAMTSAVELRSAS